MVESMKRFLFFCIALIFLGIGLFFFVEYLYTVNEEIVLVEGKFGKTYNYEKKQKLLKPKFRSDLNELSVLRETKNSLKIKSEAGFKIYANEGYNVYRLIQDSRVAYTGPKKVAILYISTGKYITFWNNFYTEMEKYFLPRHKKTYFLFTDHDDIKVAENVEKIHQDQLPWPYITLKRFHFFDAIKEKLKEYDYVYFLNGTMLPITEINEEVLPTKEQELVFAMRGADFGRKNIKWLRYCRIKKSVSYIAPDEGKYYVIGGLNGGTSEAFLRLINVCKKWTDIDLKNNIIPGWHDESYLNRYYLDELANGLNPLLLMPEYGIPEYDIALRSREFRPYAKILILSKSERGGISYFRDTN